MTKTKQIEELLLMLQSVDNSLESFRDKIGAQSLQRIDNSLYHLESIRGELYSLDNDFFQSGEGRDIIT